VIGYVTVPAGQTLTIQPGVEVRFDGFYGLCVDGILIAVGTEGDMITITSNKATPERGDWRWIRVNSTGHADIKYNDISYGWDGIHLDSTSNNTIANNRLSMNYWSGIYLEYSSYNNITDNNISMITYESGIYLDSSSYNTIKGNVLFSTGHHGIHFYLGSSNNIVTGNDISSGGNGIYLMGEYCIPAINNVVMNNKVSMNYDNGITLTWQSNGMIANNTISSNKNGISVEYSSNYIITNNTVSSHTESGILLLGSPSNSIIGNNVFSNTGPGIVLLSEATHPTTDNTIISNNISNNKDGIDLFQASNNNIIGNNISDNGYGIDLFFSSNIVMTNNSFVNDGVVMDGYQYDPQLFYFNSHTIPDNNIVNGKPLRYYKDCNGISIDSIPVGQLILANCSNVDAKNLEITHTDIGIQVIFSTNILITGSDISHNLRGIYLYSSSNNNLTGSNVSSHESGGGIVLLNSSKNSIIGNNVSNNEYGIYLYSSSLNRIYHNRIIYNSHQALQDSYNFWNDSYPSGGNYWSDYSPTCQDNFDGAITPQTTGSPDDICDVQRDIYMNGIDFYPSAVRPPKPPANISAELTGDNLENVTISWDASPDDPTRVTSYDIYYSPTYDNGELNYEFLSEIPATGASKYNYAAQDMGEGDPSYYFFYVQATDMEGYIIKNDTQVAKFTRHLSPGKQLVSVPLIQGDESVASVLQTLEFDIAWTYNNTDLLDPWKSYNPSKSYNDLTTVDLTMALWINVTENSNLTVAGIVPRVTTIELKAGWNFVGYPSFTKKRVGFALSGVWLYERVEGYSQLPPENLRIYSDSDLMETGYGYWIKFSNDATWTLEN